MNRFENRRDLALLLLLLALSTIIDGLDASIVNVALPTISQELHVSAGDTSWVTLTYVVALASLLLPMAKLAKNGTIKRMFIIGVAVFTASSAICGLTEDFLVLVTFRLIQGIGAALMTAAVPIMIVNFLPSDKKGLGMGVLAVASGVAIVIGPTVGGMITSFLTWHWIFLVNIPFGFLTILMAMFVLPRDEGYDKDKNPDFVNSVLTILGIGWGMTFIQNLVGSDIDQRIVLFCGIGAVVCLVMMARRMHASPEKALISPDMLKRTDFRLLTLAFTMTCMVIMGVQYVLPYHLQVTGEYSVHESGLLLSVASLFAIILSVPVGRWCDKRGCKVPSVLAGVGRLLFCLIFLMVSPKDEIGLLIIGLGVMGCSMAFAGTGLATALIHHSDIEHQGDAATFLLEVNYVAASLGIVMFSLIFQLGLGDANIDTVTADQVGESFELAMMFGCILSVVAIVCASVVKNIVPKKD